MVTKKRNNPTTSGPLVLMNPRPVMLDLEENPRKRRRNPKRKAKRKNPAARRRRRSNPVAAAPRRRRRRNPAPMARRRRRRSNPAPMARRRRRRNPSSTFSLMNLGKAALGGGAVFGADMAADHFMPASVSPKLALGIRAALPLAIVGISAFISGHVAEGAAGGAIVKLGEIVPQLYTQVMGSSAGAGAGAGASAPGQQGIRPPMRALSAAQQIRMNLAQTGSVSGIR